MPHPELWRVWGQIGLCAKYSLPDPNRAAYRICTVVDPDSWGNEKEWATSDGNMALRLEAATFQVVRYSFWMETEGEARSWLEWEKVP